MNSISETHDRAKYMPGPWEAIVDITAWKYGHTVDQLRRKLDDASEEAQMALRNNKAIADAQGGFGRHASDCSFEVEGLTCDCCKGGAA